MILLAFISLSSCGDDKDEPNNETPVNTTPEESHATEFFTVNGVAFWMFNVPGGSFAMGAANDDYDADASEKPAHLVTVSTFAIGRTEVTQQLWVAIMGKNPSFTKGDKLPVTNISYNDCLEFIAKLNSLTGRHFRLPTEAEWEYAARGGNKSMGYKYSGSNAIGSVAWYEGNSYNSTHEVGTKTANELGLHDMTGNVWEWCSDWKGLYSSTAQENPKGPTTGELRVYRGGSMVSSNKACRISIRLGGYPSSCKLADLGFRLAL